MAGEMSTWDIKEGGDCYEWSQEIKFAALRLMRMTKKAIKLKKMRPFDMYRGPYATLNHGCLWNGDSEKLFFYEGVIDIQGTIREIADAINAKIIEDTSLIA